MQKLADISVFESLCGQAMSDATVFNVATVSVHNGFWDWLLGRKRRERRFDSYFDELDEDSYYAPVKEQKTVKKDVSAPWEDATEPLSADADKPLASFEDDGEVPVVESPEALARLARQVMASKSAVGKFQKAGNVFLDARKDFVEYYNRVRSGSIDPQRAKLLDDVMRRLKEFTHRFRLTERALASNGVLSVSDLKSLELV